MQEEINLAGNQIGCFREIPNLARLPKLRKVNFVDPLHGDNPVATLCNYQTCAMPHVARAAQRAQHAGHRRSEASGDTLRV